MAAGSRSLGTLLRNAALALLLAAVPSGAAASVAAPEPVFGAATGEIDEPGSLTPLGNGRFAIHDRVYVGRGVGRSVVDDWGACFTGQLTSTEEWLLEAVKMSGTHQSTVAIRSDRGALTLRLRGPMELLTASGGWEIVRGVGACAGLIGEGRYTASFSSTSPQFRLTFDGQVRT
jgi:hypothetical protein